jgi:putative copper resistance protein D
MNELLILSRAIHFGSCLILLSIFAVRLVIERALADQARARLRAGSCLAAAVASGLLWFWVSTAQMAGSGLMDSLNPQLLGMVLTQTPPGHVWLLRAGIAIALGVLLCIRRGNWRRPVGLVLAAAFLCSLAWLGHAGAGEDGRRAVMLCIDCIHLLAAGIWPGGLLPFALLLRRLVKMGALRAAYATARRFSAMSLIAVGVLAASGLGNSFFLVGSLHALTATNYGRLLLIKLFLFAAALTLGAMNLLIHKPRLERVPSAIGSMTRKVWIEAALGALIVVVVAILGTLPPGSSPGG